MVPVANIGQYLLTARTTNTRELHQASQGLLFYHFFPTYPLNKGTVRVIVQYDKMFVKKN